MAAACGASRQVLTANYTGTPPASAAWWFNVNLRVDAPTTPHHTAEAGGILGVAARFCNHTGPLAI